MLLGLSYIRNSILYRKNMKKISFDSFLSKVRFLRFRQILKSLEGRIFLTFRLVTAGIRLS